jgi:P-type conjugative transfer protein TrbJ
MKQALLILLTVGILTSPNIGHCLFGVGDVVFDPANYGQALLQVKAAYDSYAQDLKNYATQLNQYREQITQSAQGARNLLSTPLNIVADLDDLYQRYQSTVSTVQGLSYKAAEVKAQFTALYNGTGTGSAALLAKVRQMAQQQRAADEQAARMQALRERSDQTQTAMRRALEAVRTAQGNLQAQQAQGQLAGVMATQQQQLMEMVAASQRSALMYQAQQQTLAEMALNEGERLMSDWHECPSCTAAQKTFDLPTVR